MKTISFLIPYRKDFGQRDRILQWNLQRLKSFKAEGWDVEICIGDHDNTRELFNRSLAINKAAKNSHGDYYFVLDGDCCFSPNLFQEIVNNMEKFPWMIAHSGMTRLKQEITEEMLTYPLFEVTQIQEEHIDMFVHSCSGLDVISKENFEKIGGYDENFWGWGFEDIAFMITCNTLLGCAGRGSEPIYHLWHVWRQDNLERNPNFYDCEARIKLYDAASYNVEEVKKLRGL